MLANPLVRYAIGAVAGLLALIGAYFYGRSTGIDHQKAADLAALQRGLKAVQQVQGTIDALRTKAAERETIREEKVREIYRDVPVVIDKPIYRTVCVDASGVGLLDRAVAAANGAESGPGAAGNASGVPEGAPPR